MLIKIFGGRGEGKTTVAKLIQETLEQHGIQVANEEAEVSGAKLENLKKMQALEVEIKCIPYARESLPDYAKEWNQKRDS